MCPSRSRTTRMPPRPSSTTRELLALYSRAGHGENNLGVFLREHSELLARLDVRLDLSQDDAALALALAPFIGRYKKDLASANMAERGDLAERAAGQLAASARHEWNRVVLDVDVLLGDVLAGPHKYIGLELQTGRVSVLRHVLVKARSALRRFLDVGAYADARGLHLVWRAGRGGLNLLPQREERGAATLVVRLRPAPAMRKASGDPTLLGDLLVELGFM
jgi:hypothetical protein